TDYKNNPVPEGVYTARFILQPQDGDHLGTALYSTFLALISAEADQALDSFDGYAPMVEASGRLTSTGHPVVISLWPPSSNGSAPAITEPDPEHKAIRLNAPAKTPDGDPAELVFNLVFHGHGHIQ